MYRVRISSSTVPLSAASTMARAAVGFLCVLALAAAPRTAAGFSAHGSHLAMTVALASIGASRADLGKFLGDAAQVLGQYHHVSQNCYRRRLEVTSTSDVMKEPELVSTISDCKPGGKECQHSMTMSKSFSSSYNVGVDVMTPLLKNLFIAELTAHFGAEWTDTSENGLSTTCVAHSGQKSWLTFAAKYRVLAGNLYMVCCDPGVEALIGAGDSNCREKLLGKVEAEVPSKLDSGFPEGILACEFDPKMNRTS